MTDSVIAPRWPLTPACSQPGALAKLSGKNHQESLAVAEGNASAVKIVGRQLYRDHVALNDFDEKLSHLAGNMGQDQMFIL